VAPFVDGTPRARNPSGVHRPVVGADAPAGDTQCDPASLATVETPRGFAVASRTAPAPKPTPPHLITLGLRMRAISIAPKAPRDRITLLLEPGGAGRPGQRAAVSLRRARRIGMTFGDASSHRTRAFLRPATLDRCPAASGVLVGAARLEQQDQGLLEVRGRQPALMELDDRRPHA
jgi:hypothetical protein